MCNLSEYVYEKGEESGLIQGRREMKKSIVKAMIAEGYPEASILRVVCIAPEEYEEWKAETI